MADEFRKMGRAAIAHQPQPRFGVERDARHVPVFESQAHDQIRLAIMSRADFGRDDDRAGCGLRLQRGGSMNTMSLPSSTPDGRRRKICRFQLFSFSSALSGNSSGITRPISCASVSSGSGCTDARAVLKVTGSSCSWRSTERPTRLQCVIKNSWLGLISWHMLPVNSYIASASTSRDLRGET